MTPAAPMNPDILPRLAASAPTALLPTDITPLSEWRIPALPAVVQYYDKVADCTRTIDTAPDEWPFHYNGTPLWVKFHRFQAAARPLVKAACASYVRQSGRVSELSKVTRLYDLDLQGMLETPLTDLRIWWSGHPEVSGRVSRAMPARALLRWCIDNAQGHWARASQAQLNTLSNVGEDHVARIERRDKVVPAAVQAAVTRLLDDGARQPAVRTDEELAALVSLAWSFQHGMRPVQQLTVRKEDVRLYEDAHGQRQAHLVFQKVKQRRSNPEPLVRTMKSEWVPLLDELVRRGRVAGAIGRNVLGFANSAELAYRQAAILRETGIGEIPSPYHFRHTAAQMLADAGHPRELIQQFLGHTNPVTAKAYLRASRNQAELLNRALGASELYKNIESIAVGRFASIAEIENAKEDDQIAGVVGTTPVAGLGLCTTGQPSCPYNPVTSCYGCDRFIPSRDRQVHDEAIAGMREQVVHFEKASGGEERSPAYVQLTRPIAVAQQTLKALDEWEAGNA